MKRISIYFAGAWTPKTDLGVHNRLVSYFYKSDFLQWMKLTGNKRGNVILDSGAFSSWNKNKNIDLNKYIDYIKEAKDIAKDNSKKLLVVNLDVIPGKAGKTKSLNKIYGSEEELKANKQMITDAAKQGYKNLLKMLKNDITPIHVFHQGEDFIWLDRMVDKVDYIGISPANDMTNESKKAWMFSVFEYMYKKNIKVKTHGFAVLAPEILKKLPFTSGDAISWRMIAATGGIIYPKRGFDVELDTNMEKPYNMISVGSLKSYKGHIKSQENILKLFERDGYTLEDLKLYAVREVINVRTFQYFERWLNKHRIKTEYIPELKLL